MHKCPTGCSGGKSSRQNELNNMQLERLSDSARNRIEESKGRAYRCNYCGCVYLKELEGMYQLGSLDGGIRGEGWHSENYA